MKVVSSNKRRDWYREERTRSVKRREGWGEEPRSSQNKVTHHAELTSSMPVPAGVVGSFSSLAKYWMEKHWCERSID